MVHLFNVPTDLVEFVHQAAIVAAEVVNEAAQRELQITALHVTGPLRKPRIAAARHIAAALIRRHVWIDKGSIETPKGVLSICISFGNNRPFNGNSMAMPMVLIGWLFGRCHSTLLRKPKTFNIEPLIDVADQRLSASYGENEQIEMRAKVHAGVRTLRGTKC